MINKDLKNIPYDISSSIPKEEEVLWYGEPDWKLMSWHVFGLKYLFLYLFFSLILVFYKPIDFNNFSEFLIEWLPYLICTTIAACFFVFLSIIQTRSTHYVITNKRIVIKTGSALIFFLNAPFKKIISIDRQHLRFGRGNISFQTVSKKRIPFFSSWPSVRPWFFANPQPCFRCIKNVDYVEAILSKEARKQIEKNNYVSKFEVEAAI